MPSFNTLIGKHSNRSQHALVESQSSSSGGVGRADVSATEHRHQSQQHQQQQQQQHQRQQSQVVLDEADLPTHDASASSSAHTHAHSIGTPHSALSTHNTAAYSSSESFDSRPAPPPHHLQQQPPPSQQLQQQPGGHPNLIHPHFQQQQQQQQQLPPQSQVQQVQQPPQLSSSLSTASEAPPPPPLYSSPSAASSTTAAINNPQPLQQSPNPNHQIAFDGNQTRPEFVNRGAIGRSQSIRYSTHISQQQPGVHYGGIATTSVDDLAAYGHGPSPVPVSPQPQQGQQSHQGQHQEKRSTRKLISGIFRSSHKGEQQQQQQQQQQQHGTNIGHTHHPSYDNSGGGLGRRPSTSKRVRNPPPSIRTSFSQRDHSYSPSQSHFHSQPSSTSQFQSQSQSLTHSHSHSQSHSRSPSQSFSPTNSQPSSATAALLVQAQVQTPFQAQAAKTQPQPQTPGLDWQPPAQARTLLADAQPAPYFSHYPPLQGRNDADEHSAHESNSHLPSQNSHNPLRIRHVSGPSEIDHQQQPPYDDAVYRQHEAPPQQPHVQVHHQDQPPPPQHFDPGAYDQQHSPQNPPHQGYSYPNSQQQQQQQQPQPQPQAQYPPSIIQGVDSRISLTHLGPSPHQQNPETVSQLSHESPITDSDQRSAHLHSAQTSPAVNHSVYVQNHGSTPSLPPVQQTTPQPQQTGMAPPGGPPPPRRNNPDSDKAPRGQVDAPVGPPPAYRQNSAPLNTMNPLPPVPGQAPGQTTGQVPGQTPGQAPGQPPVYRNNQPPQFEGQQPIEQGRDSPQPSSAVPSEPNEGEKAFKDLLTKYKNVKRLYFDGKSQIEALSGQVEQLQNAVANQRMSQSRTALDDNEYSTRFNRLNGAINNLSFNIRKDWRCVPQWLDKYVSVDALKTGKQEMTAVGRAVISRWLVEEVFNKCFHPGLDHQLSQSLKEIELSIRQNAYTMSSQEEFDALTNKVVSWRMTTLEGLHRSLNSPATADNRTLFIEKATSNLTACLYQFLNNPPPPGVEGSTSMIVELAAGIAANLPLESRDVAISLPLPGDAVQPHLMEVEKTPLPVLEAQKEEGDGSDDEEGDRDRRPKNGMLKKAPKPGAIGLGSKDASSNSKSGADVGGVSALPMDPSRVRFAGFMALEVRGRQVLTKAPVWTL